MLVENTLLLVENVPVTFNALITIILLHNSLQFFLDPRLLPICSSRATR